MSDQLQDFVDGIQGFARSLQGITDDHGGILRCTVCEREEPVEARYWREGWPKCCGYTMRWVTARELAEELAAFNQGDETARDYSEET